MNTLFLNMTKKPQSDHFYGKWLSHPPPGEEVVISGIAGEFPESENVNVFRENLFNKIDMVTVDDRRWRLDYPQTPKRFGKLKEIANFDPGFFGLHYRQANSMDLTMRKILEHVIEAIMDAGVNPSELKGTKTGVFAAGYGSEVAVSTIKSFKEPQQFAVTGNMRIFVAHRISYFLKVKGPSTVVDSACSSSLTAIDVAFQAIRNGECDNAIICGSSLLVLPQVMAAFAMCGVLSPEGKCKTFDKDANGYLRSEAVVCVFLQKAQAARRIYGKVIHMKQNVDGFKVQSINFPSTKMQERMMTEALFDSKLDPNDVAYVEAHGTGTVVGDPAESQAIDNAIAKKRSKPLIVGSVKSNIGHAEVISGLCSLSKVIIMMETGSIIPNDNFKEYNPSLKGFVEGRMKVVTDLTPIETGNDVFVINNYGFGGSNAHMLLRRLDKIKSPGDLHEDLPRLVCVSGRSENSVSILLDELDRKKLDPEYVGLLHHLFKNNVRGHLCRGFAIVSKNSSTIRSTNTLSQQTSDLYIIFGRFFNNFAAVGRYLLQFPVFEDIIEKIDNCNNNRNEIRNVCDKATTHLGEAVLQLGIVELLKLLEIQTSVVYEDNWGKIIAMYYQGKLGLAETLSKLEVLDKKCITNGIENEDNNNYENKVNVYNRTLNKHKNFILLNISDKTILENNSCTLTENNFLQILGRLYNLGHNPQIHKLYPTIEFPVSRGTPMLSPVLKWNHKKKWNTFSYHEFEKVHSTPERMWPLSTEIYRDQKYLEDHVVDGRSLVPATEYLNLVWKVFALQLCINQERLPVVFENCRFLKAQPIGGNIYLSLKISIHIHSGKFEIFETESSSLVMTGRIFTPVDIEKYKTDLPLPPINEEGGATEFLESNEIYRELNLRGYNYRNTFRGLVKCNVEGTYGLVKWENNWTTFIDTVLQLKIFEVDARTLFVPVSFNRVIIDPIAHLEFIKETKNFLCPVYSYKDCQMVKCGGIEISGIASTSILRKLPATPVLEKYVFVQNEIETNLTESVIIIVQIILENNLDSYLDAVEVVDEYSSPKSEFVLSLVSKILRDISAVNSHLSICSKTNIEPPDGVNVQTSLQTSGDLLLVVATKVLQRPKTLEKFLTAIKPGGYILSREEADYVPRNPDVLVIHRTGEECLVLFQNCKPEKPTKYIQITWKHYEWMTPLKEALKQGENIVVYSQNDDSEGITGLVNCLRKESEENKIRCFFIMDKDVQFNPELAFYKQQLRKNLAVNILKNGKWGTYRHLPLDEVEEVESEHSFVTVGIKGHLNTLKWVEGPLTRETKVKDGDITIYPYYTAINFKDVLTTTGRVNFDGYTRNRLVSTSIQGAEISGRDICGRRITGFITNHGISSIIQTENTCMYLPDDWTLEQAATAPLVYATVMYALFNVAKLKSHASILIHSATSCVGMAALNVCLYFNCDIYVTVGTEEKKNYIKKHFPQISDSRIGHSRDTSFETMIKRETKGRGVDFVLCALIDDKREASARCLTQGGALLDIGAYDMVRNSAFNTILMENKISYHGVLLDQISYEIRVNLLNQLKEGIRLGYIKPLPTIVFEKNEVDNAFMHMMTGKHIGKVLIKIRDEEKQKILPLEKNVHKTLPTFLACPEKSYIIVGGLGGFGLELADWLFLKGARKFILSSSSGLTTGYQAYRIRNWRSYGATVQVFSQDITIKQNCLELIRQAKNLGPIDAVFNLAVVLKDALFSDQTETTFDTVLKPKVLITRQLDEITRDECPELRYFVVFSSQAGARGNPGQTNYGMANSSIERICEKRKLEGYPGLAIQWGMIGDVGIVANMQKGNTEISIGGTQQQKISNCLEVLDRFLQQKSPIVSSFVISTRRKKVSSLDGMTNMIADVLGIKNIKTIDPNRLLTEIGMDSMTAAEIAQILKSDLGVNLTPDELRNLTLKKVMEMEFGQKNVKSRNVDINSLTSMIKGKSTNTPLILSLPERSTVMTKILPSKIKGDINKKTVFILPSFDGCLQAFEPLASRLPARVRGVLYNFNKCENRINDTAKTILPHIEAHISKNEPFVIVGHLYGSIVGLEIVALLEKKGYLGNFISIEGSPEYMQTWLETNSFLSDQNKLQLFIIFNFLTILTNNDATTYKDKIALDLSFNEKLETAANFLPADIDKQYFKDSVHVIYKRCSALIDYRFTHNKLKSNVYLCKAKRPLVTDLKDDYSLSQLCRGFVQAGTVEEDYLKIISNEKCFDYLEKWLH